MENLRAVSICLCTVALDVLTMHMPFHAQIMVAIPIKKPMAESTR
jgi:hypothetical protein